VWFKDPLEDMKRNASLDYFDARFQYVGFPRDVFSPFNANSGYFYMKNNSYSRTCWDNMFYAQEKVGAWTNSQQLALNHYLGLCAGAEHLRVMTLPREQYPSGWVQIDKKMNEVNLRLTLPSYTLNPINIHSTLAHLTSHPPHIYSSYTLSFHPLSSCRC
jgi:hypothetical protein